MRKLIAGVLSCLMVAVFLGGAQTVSAQSEHSIAGTSKADVKRMVKDRPSWKDRFAVQVEAREGTELDFSQLGGESDSGVGNVGIVWFKNENQVDKLYKNPDVAKLYATDAPDTVKPSVGGIAPASMPITAASIQNPLPSNDGSGTVIAIIDTGFDTSESSITSGGKVVKEYCVVDDLSCPGGTNTSTAVGSSDWGFCEDPNATGYPYTVDECWHGTAMAQIAAGDSPGDDWNGIAPGAKLVLIRAARMVSGVTTFCEPCIRNALSWLYTNRNSFGAPLVAVNMSFGDFATQFDEPCANDEYATGAYDTYFDNFRFRAIMPVVAAGNDSATNAIQGPACHPQVVSVAGLDGVSIDDHSDLNGHVTTSAQYRQDVKFSGGVAGVAPGTSGAAAAVSGTIATVAEHVGVNATTPPINKYTDLQIFAALKYAGDFRIDDRAGCSCWGLNEIDGGRVADRLQESVLFENSNTNLFVPFRILDTRYGYGWESGNAVTTLGTTQKVIHLAERIGKNSAQSKGVMLQVTVRNASTTGYVTIARGTGTHSFKYIHTYSGMPTTTTMVWTQMATGNAGDISVYNSAGTVDVAIDVVGALGSLTDTDTLVSIPTNIDTANGGTAIGAASSQIFDLRNVNSIPSTATGVYGSLCVDNSGSGVATAVTAKAADGNAPVITNVQADAGQRKCNFVFIPFATSGANTGKVEIYNASGSVHVVLNAFGYVTSGDADVYASTPARAVTDSAMVNGSSHTIGDNNGGCSAGGRIINTALSAGANNGYVNVNINLQPTPMLNGNVYANAGDIVDNAMVVPHSVSPNFSSYAVANQASYYNVGAGDDNDLFIDVMGCLSS